MAGGLSPVHIYCAVQIYPLSEHTVASMDGGSEVVHHVWFSGALAFLFGPDVVKQLKKGLPRTMLSLKAYAEKRHEAMSGEA